MWQRDSVVFCWHLLDIQCLYIPTNRNFHQRQSNPQCQHWIEALKKTNIPLLCKIGGKKCQNLDIYDEVFTTDKEPLGNPAVAE